MQTSTDTHTPAIIDETTRAAPAGAVLADETTRAEIRSYYPAAAFRGPLFGTRDRIAIAMAAVMMLGPLAALPLGF